MVTKKGKGKIMADRLKMDYINSLPQPFLIAFFGNPTEWELNNIDVETGLLQFNVCGKLQVEHIGMVKYFKDMNGIIHDPDTFYMEDK